MSGTYWLQSRIASGSQAARCCGVHCCALAGEDAHASTRPRSARPAASRKFNAARILFWPSVGEACPATEQQGGDIAVPNQQTGTMTCLNLQVIDFPSNKVSLSHVLWARRAGYSIMNRLVPAFPKWSPPTIVPDPVHEGSRNPASVTTHSGGISF